MEVKQKEKGIFRAILEEYYRMPVVDVVQAKRKRFSMLLHAVAKSLFQDNYDKTWRLCTYLIMLLEDAEYPDEYVECPLDEILIYLHVVYASSAAQTSQNIEGCLTICNMYMKYCRLYPMLYPTMVICHLKLGQYDTARSIIQEGMEFITTDFHLIVPKKYRHGEITLEYVQNLGHNSPKYIMFLFYAYGKLLGMNIEDDVGEFMERHSLQTEFQYIKSLVDSNNLRCCAGSTMEALNRLKHKITLQNMYAVSDYTELKIHSANIRNAGHVLNHCNIQYIAVNDLLTNHIVTNFSDVNFLRPASNLPQNYYVTYKVTSLHRKLKRNSKRKISWTIRKPLQTRFKIGHRHTKYLKQRNGLMSGRDLKLLYRMKVLTRLFSIIRNVRTNIIEELYLELVSMRMAACKLYAGMEDVLARMIYIYNEFAVPLAKGTVNQIYTFTEQIINAIKVCVTELKIYVDRFQTATNSEIFNILHSIEAKRLEKLSLSMRAQLRRFSFCIYFKIHQIVVTHRRSDKHTNQFTKSMRHLIENTEKPTFSFKNNNTAFCECKACFFSNQVFVKRDRQLTDCVPIQSTIDPTQNNNTGQKPGTKTCTKETQTKYSKFSCSSKQTQTEKRLSEEYALKKQIHTLNTNNNDMINKIGDLEDKLYELSESKKEILENENKMIRSLKRELADARRIIHDKSKEIEQQKDQVEQLKFNLSKLNKPYSHAVKTPEEFQQKSVNLIKLNEKLQTTNATLINENNSLHKHLVELTDEYDKMKAKCDKVLEYNEDLESLYQKKSCEYDDLIGKLKTFKIDTTEKVKKEQNKVLEMKALIHTAVKDIVDALLEKINLYKLRCQRIHQELICLFYNSSAQYNIKQTCETNQIFLATTAGQLERNLHLLAAFKGKITDDPLMNFINLINSLNWKTTLTCTEEFCAGMFNQYVQNLNTLMNLNTAFDNSRFVNQNPIMPEPEKLYRPAAYNQANTLPIPLPEGHSYVNQSSKVGPGPVGANRPQSSTTEYQKAKAQSPIEIEDPNAKTILSEIANAVNYPSSMSPTYNMDKSQGVVRRPIASPARQKINEVERVATPENFQWNKNVSAPSSMPLDCSDYNTYNGKYRDIFLMVQRRFPNALMGDLIDALNFVKNTHNSNLYKVSNDNIIETVSNYIANNSKNRMMNLPPTEVAKMVFNTDENCSICFEKLSSLPTCTLKCLHVFHSKCIRLWINRNNICPICRKFTILE